MSLSDCPTSRLGALNPNARGCVSAVRKMTRRSQTALCARAAIASAGALSFLLTACATETPQTAFNPHSDYAIVGLDLFQTIIVMGVIVGVLVEGVLIWAAIRYRRRSNEQLP